MEANFLHYYQGSWLFFQLRILKEIVFNDKQKYENIGTYNSRKQLKNILNLIL